MTPVLHTRKTLPLLIFTLIGLLVPQPTTPTEPWTKDDKQFAMGVVLAGSFCVLVTALLSDYYCAKNPEEICQDLQEKYKEAISIYTVYAKEGIAACDLDEAVLYQCGLVMFPEKASQLEEDISFVSQALTKELDVKKELEKDSSYSKSPDYYLMFERTCTTIVNLQELKTHLMYLQTILYAHKQYFDLCTAINEVKAAHKSELTLVAIAGTSNVFYKEHFGPLLHACINTRYKKYPYVYYAQLIEEHRIKLQSVDTQLAYLRYKTIHNQTESLLFSLGWLWYDITHNCIYQQELGSYAIDLQHKKEAEKTSLYLQEQRIEAEWARFKAKNAQYYFYTQRNNA
jgi:hypothetical protein